MRRVHSCLDAPRVDHQLLALVAHGHVGERAARLLLQFRAPGRRAGLDERREGSVFDEDEPNLYQKPGWN